MDKIKLVPQLFHAKIIPNSKGDIFMGLKDLDAGFNGFGEVYLTTIKKNQIKGWKLHLRMHLNLVVPVGEVEFIVKNTEGEKHYFNLSQKPYQRLYVPPNYWVAFKGVGSTINLIMNVANIVHDDEEQLIDTDTSEI
jgi:dTDP-4-dehydrorhamnose 3,5-epimerase